MARPSPVLLLSRGLGGGGSERQITETATALDRSRFEPHVGCFFSSGLRARELQAAGVALVEFSVRSFLSPSVLRAAAQAGRYLRRHQIRVVHAFDVPAALFGVPVARWFRAPIVIASQRAGRNLTPGVNHHLLRVTDQMVDALVVNSATLRRQLIEEDKVPPALVRLCYNAIDTNRFQPAETWASNSELVIGATSMLRPEKGLRTLLEAFAQVRGAAEARLLLVGDGPARAELETLAVELGIRGQCTFAGEIPLVAPWLRQMDIFVLPSFSEALSNSLMEAMASGCPVVASRVGGNPELGTDGETGLMFDAGNAADLARQIRTLMECPALRASLGAAAANRIRSQFSREVSVRRFEDLYSELLDRVGYGA